MHNDILFDIEKDINGNWEDIQKRKINDEHERKLKNFFNLLDGLIALNKNNRCVDLKKYNLLSYLNEYCTVKLNIGRQQGYTSYIKKNATKDDVIIVLNANQMMVYNKTQTNVFTLQFMLDRDVGNRYKTIWFDNFTYRSGYGDKKERIDNALYNKFGNKNIEQTFILLG